jgi:hypothetical protein
MTELIVVTPDDLDARISAAVRSALPNVAFPPEVAELERLRRKALLTANEVEKLYGLNARTLCNKRGQGTGPEYIQEVKNGPVYYEHDAILKYLDACRKKTYEQRPRRRFPAARCL